MMMMMMMLSLSLSLSVSLSTGAETFATNQQECVQTQCVFNIFRITSQGGEIITPPCFRRRGGFWIQDFVITPEALEQVGSKMSTRA